MSSSSMSTPAQLPPSQTSESSQSESHSQASQISPKYFTYLFGFPIAHSWSPLLHNTLYSLTSLPWTYKLHESTSLPSFLALLHSPTCRGASVTMPHKIAIIPHLDDLTDEAREIGAVNTIYIREEPNNDSSSNSSSSSNMAKTRRYIGTNTDVIGIREAFARNIPNIYPTTRGRAGMVIGGGGAARSAIYALHRYFTCPTIYIVNRDPGEVDTLLAFFGAIPSFSGLELVHVRTVGQARAVAGPVLAVGCVPDFPPVSEAEREARAVLEVLFGEKGVKGALLEMAYHPRIWTGLADVAEKRGWKVVLGTEAVIWQGIEQHRLWTGRKIEDIPVRECQEVFNRALEKAENQRSKL